MDDGPQGPNADLFSSVEKGRSLEKGDIKIETGEEEDRPRRSKKAEL